MIILNESQIEFSFPEVHPDAKMACSLIRTLRIPDNGETYPLPPGLGAFPVRHVADYQVGGFLVDQGGLPVLVDPL